MNNDNNINQAVPTVPPTPSMPTSPAVSVQPNIQNNTGVAPQIPVAPVTPQTPTIPVAPQVPTAPSIQSVPNNTVNIPTVETPKTASTDSVTFDYNALYGNNSNEAQQQATNTNVQNNNDSNSIVFEEPLNINVKVAELPKAVDTTIIPEFNTNALDTNPNNLSTIQKIDNQPSINFVGSASEQKKNTEKNNTIFIVAVFAIIIFSVLVIFPWLVNHL